MAVHLMRIVAGSARGRRLKSPKGLETRPMMDRVKEAVFSSLGAAIDDAVVLDLYAGSGSLGLEALSRGAASATFVEWSREARVVLKDNLTALGLDGDVVAMRVEEYLERPGPKVGVAFVDPPYALALPSVEHVLGLLARRLADGAVVVLHRRAGSGEVAPPPGLEVVDRRRYGDAEVTRLVKE
ncbi:MAG TPA: 16S rRNA (guanine(966)-N(2))-methyltransferase RsmD [Acidimicrobiia bacterium]|nr:16S rRNA (guanine(966)-N(2))-methyltransferase RsmD [Acidimicrobiia bacterium]